METKDLVEALTKQIAVDVLAGPLSPGVAFALVDLAGTIYDRLDTAVIECDEYAGGKFKPIQCMPGRWSAGDWATRAESCAHCPVFKVAVKKRRSS
jgi:hypothetical protein